MRFHMVVGNKLFIWGAVLSTVFITVQSVPQGHLEPLGSHRPKEGSLASLDDVPFPRDFFYNYVLTSTPVIFRGAAKLSKGFEVWNDRYLREHYGSEVVRVDYGKKENRHRSADEMSLTEFLSIYNTSDRYLIDTLPTAMWKEFSLPRCLLCGGFTDALQDSVLWFSSGDTKSHLHNDKVENINCLLSGEKTWFFVDAENSKKINMDHKEGEYCSVNVDSVDMYKYPSLQDIPWWSAEIKAGDCIYVPYGWAHQVTSVSRNLAVNIWWSPGIAFNDTKCEAPLQRELDNFHFTHGEMLRFQAIQVINEHGGTIGFEQINALIVHEHTGERLITKERFALLDTNSDGILNEEELRKISTDEIEDAFGGAPPGEVNLIGKSLVTDDILTDLLSELPKQPPHIEEFLLRPDKLPEEIETFLKKHRRELPKELTNYLEMKMSETKPNEYDEHYEL